VLAQQKQPASRGRVIIFIFMCLIRTLSFFQQIEGNIPQFIKFKMILRYCGLYYDSIDVDWVKLANEGVD
jgi:hypothetical protein